LEFWGFSSLGSTIADFSAKQGSSVDSGVWSSQHGRKWEQQENR
jgi:hypothetical protein